MVHTQKYRVLSYVNFGFNVAGFENSPVISLIIIYQPSIKATGGVRGLESPFSDLALYGKKCGKEPMPTSKKPKKCIFVAFLRLIQFQLITC